MAETRCEKCGGSDIYMRWHGEGPYHETRGRSDSCRSEYGPMRGKPKGEHLHYSCRGCGFSWTGPLTPSSVDLQDLQTVRAAGEGDT